MIDSLGLANLVLNFSNSRKINELLDSIHGIANQSNNESDILNTLVSQIASARESLSRDAPLSAVLSLAQANQLCFDYQTAIGSISGETSVRTLELQDRIDAMTVNVFSNDQKCVLIQRQLRELLSRANHDVPNVIKRTERDLVLYCNDLEVLKSYNFDLIKRVVEARKQLSDDLRRVEQLLYFMNYLWSNEIKRSFSDCSEKWESLLSYASNQSRFCQDSLWEWNDTVDRAHSRMSKCHARNWYKIGSRDKSIVDQDSSDVILSTFEWLFDCICCGIKFLFFSTVRFLVLLCRDLIPKSCKVLDFLPKKLSGGDVFMVWFFRTVFALAGIFGLFFLSELMQMFKS